MSVGAGTMGRENPLIAAGLWGLNQLFAERVVTPLEVCDAYLDRIARLNSGLNCFVALDVEGARNAASRSAQRWSQGAALGRLDGAPIAVKANMAVSGMPFTAALGVYKGRVAEGDCDVVARLRNAGAVVLGLVNMHEAALGATTTSPLYGPAYNPIGQGLTPGGSSGGSAAAVAAGLAAAALGTDTMGSVRIPSAYCGIAGFKPSKDRLSTKGVVPLSFTLDHVGIHARNAQDLAVLMTAICRDDLGFAQDSEAIDFAQLRVGVLSHPGVAVEAEVQAAFGRAVQCIEAAGVALREVNLEGIELASLRRKGLLVCEAELSASLEKQRVIKGDISEELARLLAYADTQSATKLAGCYATFREAEAAIRAAFESSDILILPTAPQRAFAHSQAAPANQADLTVLANVAGLPAATIAISWALDERPSGLQLMGPPGSDRLVLAVAQAIEALL